MAQGVTRKGSVMRGLDPRIHPLRKASCEERLIAGSSPAMTTGEAGANEPRSCRGLGDFLAQPAPPQQPLGRRHAAAEGGVELDRIARATGGIDVIAQVLRGTGIEDVAGLLERGEGVRVQHL